MSPSTVKCFLSGGARNTQPTPVGILGDYLTRNFIKLCRKLLLKTTQVVSLFYELLVWRLQCPWGMGKWLKESVSEGPTGWCSSSKSIGRNCLPPPTVTESKFVTGGEFDQHCCRNIQEKCWILGESNLCQLFNIRKQPRVDANVVWEWIHNHFV